MDQSDTSSAGERTFLGHPSGLFALSFTELWERFSFYSMRGFMVLYMTKAMLYEDKFSNEVYGAYLGFVYSTPFIGGMLADRFLGQRKAIVMGGILMALAQFTLAANAILIHLGHVSTSINALFFIGLGTLAAGNGFFKPNISTIVGSLYHKNDPRRDGAFTMFYMGINIGALAAGLSGQIAETVGWHWGFLMAGTGMVVGQFIFAYSSPLLHEHGYPPRREALMERLWSVLPKFWALLLAVVLFIPVAAFFLARPGLVQNLALWVAIPVVGYLIYIASRGQGEERGRMFVLLILCLFSMIFWAFFELAGSAIALFTDRHVDRSINLLFWKPEPTASLLTTVINPLFVIALAVPFAKLWVWLAKREREPSSPLKFSLGLLQLAAGFVALYIGAVQAGDSGTCSLFWLVLGFLLHTTGELCLSPVGLSTVTKLSPVRYVGMFMGVWFLASSLGNIFGGWVGGQTQDYGFATVFKGVAIGVGVASVLLFVLTPVLKKRMHGVK